MPHQWSCRLHQSHLCSRPTKEFSLLLNYQCLLYPSFRTYPYTIHNTPGNFQYRPHHHQDLHFCHPAHACALAGLHTQFNSQLTPCLQLILKGIQKNQTISLPPRVHLPITLQVMQSIYNQLTNQPHSYTHILIWAACCLAFFSFLWVSEFTIPSDASHDNQCHLSLADVSVDNRNNPQLLRVKIMQSKTHSFRKGVDIYLGASITTLCVPLKLFYLT